MKQESKVINGVTYKVTTMNALTALSVQANLVKLLGPAFSEFAGGKVDKSVVIPKAIAKLTDNMDDEKVISLITKLYATGVLYVNDKSGTAVDTPVEFNEYFSGNIGDMWMVTLFILQVNFGDVLGKLGLNSIFQEVTQKLES